GNVLQSAPVGAAAPDDDHTPTPVPAASGSTATPSPAAGGVPAAVVDLLTSPRPPALGSYTYAVSGSESVTGFGGRGYPAQATIAVHRDPSIGPDELVHDVKLSDQHEERQIIRYDASGIAFTFEGGAITFGPGTQTSQGHYDPPMVQVPFPLQAGASATATSPVKDPGGSVSRTEQWTSKVVGQETLDVLGQPRTTWVIDLQRNTTPGGPEQVDRFKRYWYDPELGVWVKWVERFHAARNMVVSFNYDTEYTATLTGFRPA
ncbi:MAG: hypothetical protein M3Z03_15565, partial [Actinomycetota bacterium]|nr:hypothetical protein [Actinomycetota bacterium]